MWLTIFIVAFLASSGSVHSVSAPPSESCHQPSDLTAEDLYFRGTFRQIGLLPPVSQYENISFRLANPALDYNPTCCVDSAFDNTTVHQCNGVPRGHSASFIFDRNTHELRINQTWTCYSDGRPMEARARVLLPLTCVTKKVPRNPSHWTNPMDLFFGQIECERGDFKVPVV